MPACPRRSSRGASAGALPPDSLGSAPPETIHVRRRPRCRSTRASTPLRRLGASAGGRPLEASNAARAQHEAHLPSVPPRRCRWPHLASTRDGSSQWSPNPLPRFAPYDTSWGSSNPGSKQSAPDICPERLGATPQRRALSLTQCADDSTFDQSSSSLSFSPLSSASSFLLGSWAMTFAAVRAGVAPFARSALHTRAWIRTRKPDLNWLSCFMP